MCGSLRSPTPAAVSGVTHFWRRVQAKAPLAESGSAQRSRAFGASHGLVAQGLRSTAIDPLRKLLIAPSMPDLRIRP